MPEIFNQQEKTKPTPKPNVPPTPSEDKPTSKPDSKISKQPLETENPKSIGLFTSFCKNPPGIRLTQQDDDENIVLLIRRDFATNVPWIGSFIVLLFIPLLLRYIFRFVDFPIPVFPPNFNLVFNIFYYLVALGFAFSNFITWFFTIGVITNKRAVDIDFVDISSVNFAAAELPDIIDAKYSQNGFLQSFFDYGDVDLVIQAPKETLIYDKAPRPADIAGIIRDLIGKK